MSLIKAVQLLMIYLRLPFFLPYKCVSDGNSSDTDEIIGQELGGQDWRGFRR